MLLETRSRGDSGSFAEKEGRRDPAQHRWPGGVPESEMERATVSETREMLRVVLGSTKSFFVHHTQQMAN